MWEREANYGDESALVSAADAAGHNGAALLEQAKQDEIEQIYAQSTNTAIEMGIFGAPAYFYDGEYFWGQDRIELLEDALKSGRPGFKHVYPG
ncbi:MAG: hypothetical protein GY948_11000 [Alphaproteobacteria bacterium]|nr:hypothetical protein [Alphaproteobacteria bacterium]